MTSRIVHDRPASAARTGHIVAVVLFVFGVIGAAKSLALPLFLLPDLAQTLSVARNVSAGAGLATGIIYYEEQHAFGVIPAPQTVFPPGYPLMIAALSLLGISERSAAKLLCFAALAVIAVTLFILLKRRHGVTAGLAAAGAWLGLSSAHQSAVSGLSELPFIALTMLAILAIPPAGQRVGARSATVCAGLGVAAFSVRYSGVFFLLAAPVAFFERTTAGRRWLPHVLGLSIAGLGSAAIVTRNVLHTGRADWLIGSDPSVDRYEWSLRHLIAIPSWLVDISGLSERAVLEGQPLPVLGVVFLTVGVLASGFALNLRRGLLSLAHLVRRDPGWRLIAFYPVLGLTALAAVLLLTGSRHLEDPRHVLPYVPALLALVVVFLCESSAHGRRPRVAGLALACFAAGFAVVQVSSHDRLVDLVTRRSVSSHVEAMLSQADSENASTLLPTLRSGPAIACPPQLVGEVLQSPVVGIPVGKYASGEWTDARIKMIARNLGVRHVVAIPLGAALGHFEPSRFCNDLLSGRIPDWLEPIASASNGVLVFRVKEPAGPWLPENPSRPMG